MATSRSLCSSEISPSANFQISLPLSDTVIFLQGPFSKAFRAAVAREIKHFILELAHYLESETPCDPTHAYIQAEAMVTLVFNAGAEALDIEGTQREELDERLIWQLRYIARGATLYGRDSKGNVEKTA